jgi:hypothetical protein
MKYILCLLSALVIFTGPMGCSYESRTTTIHEPGVYKGAKDPLLAKQKQQNLIDRFKLVQADR